MKQSYSYITKQYSYIITMLNEGSVIIYKPERIMLLILPIILSTIFTHYSLFIPMLSPIILYYSSNLIVTCKIAYGS